MKPRWALAGGLITLGGLVAAADPEIAGGGVQATIIAGIMLLYGPCTLIVFAKSWGLI